MSIDTNSLALNKDLRAKSREDLKGNWGKAVLTYLVYMVILVPIALIPLVGNFVMLFLEPPLILGMIIFYLNIVRKNDPEIKNVFLGFSYYGKSLGVFLLVILYTFLWSILLIIPGIIKAYSYSMTFYIVADNPEVGFNEAIRLSSKMMNGSKFKLFTLQLSFIGWGLLSLLTLGIGSIWVSVYQMTAMANFYEDLKRNYIDEDIFENNNNQEEIKINLEK
ncbi:DUF975 family protein [Helicovermis profundi]|uniref:DUF975 family protein n=1 Tax=Helicovermis profundi TaxID=3065157 RepID=A0AAU9EC12_9FIRM|nr:DUF975 family protein [Clostridia bacterium S502]